MIYVKKNQIELVIKLCLYYLNIKLTECIYNIGSTGPVSLPLQSYGPVQASAPAQGQPQYVSPGKCYIPMYESRS